jgi:tRNA threonylcarbamoyladenosine biosynthesis protein TsaB
MSIILNIDTAVDSAMICLAENGKTIASRKNENQKEHAAWMQPAIVRLLEENALGPRDLSAVSVSNGPGSYTGLRVGLASAKGLCYALNIPLITVDTLKIMALAVADKAVDLICPLIDARRMEVFAAVYDKNLVEQIAALAMILHDNSFEALLDKHQILFCGNGSNKFREIVTVGNASFTSIDTTENALSALAYSCFVNKDFADLAYAEPMYIKEFHSSV